MDLTSRRDFLKQLAAGVGLTMTAGPLDLFAGLQADCGRQGQGKIDVEPGLLAFGADGLNF